MRLAALSLLWSVAAPLQAPWREVAPGVETATAADLGGDANWAAKVLLVDPHLASFAVRFDPQKPTLAQWRQRYPNAVAIANGSFYSADAGEVRPTCDIVQEGHKIKGAGCLRQDALWFGARQREAKPIAQSTVAAASRTPRFFAPPDFRADQFALGAMDVVNLDGEPEAMLSLRGEPLEDVIGIYGRGLPLVLLVLRP